MQTLYIDIFFLINFTVDLLAVHFASCFTKTPIGTVRLVIVSLIGAIYACAAVFITNIWISLLLGTVVFALTFVIILKRASFMRRVKLMIAFFLFLVIIGGIVYFLYCAFDKYLPSRDTEVQNRSFLIFSVILLLTIALIRFILNVISNARSERRLQLQISLLGREISCEALVDTGNLLKDPIDSTPVVLIKEKAASGLFPDGIPQIYEGTISKELKRYIRLIPIAHNGITDIKAGIRPDRAAVLINGKYEEVRIEFVIDEEGGTFDGCEALMPAAAIEGL